LSVRLPAEWERHERTLMGWPCRQALWGPELGRAREDYATVANAIAAFEPVTMIANPGADAEQARAMCAAGVQIVALALDDSWLRDSGPIYVRRDGAPRLAVHFRFNAWGGKFPPWDRDAAVGALIARELGDEVRSAEIVLEGGSIATDGTGTLLTTEQCLLNPNRNPGHSREQLERALSDYLGAQRIVWLGQGLLEDRDTDGHVDLIAAFSRPGQALLQTVPPDNPNYEHCEENRARLRAAGIEALELPYLPYCEVAGERVAAGYLNLYVCNGAVIVPVAGADTDAPALTTIAGAYPGREVVAVPGTVLAYGGGGPHCITQQVPADDDGAAAKMGSAGE
jgi:agmatine deiminase